MLFVLKGPYILIMLFAVKEISWNWKETINISFAITAIVGKVNKLYISNFSVEIEEKSKCMGPSY